MRFKKVGGRLIAEKIFIVEDDATIVSLLKSALSEDFRVRIVTNFRAVSQEIEEAESDLVLMDIGLPFYSGFYWTEKIREYSKVPIIFISSSSDEMNQVTAINNGADDFVTKPFSVEVLKAKIRAILRRVESQKLTFLDYTLSDHKVEHASGTVELTLSEMKILSLLFRASGSIVGKEILLQAVWQTDEFIDANTLAVKISRLKKKLTLIGLDSHLITKRGSGYGLD